MFWQELMALKHACCMLALHHPEHAHTQVTEQMARKCLDSCSKEGYALNAEGGFVFLGGSKNVDTGGWLTDTYEKETQKNKDKPLKEGQQQVVVAKEVGPKNKKKTVDVPYRCTPKRSDLLAEYVDEVDAVVAAEHKGAVFGVFVGSPRLFMARDAKQTRLLVEQSPTHDSTVVV